MTLDEFLAIFGAFALIALVIGLICWSGYAAFRKLKDGIKGMQDDNEHHN
ncbi:hypothetical protein [Burkholderia gladioli]|nr:hypothetical protein [Burkholderia gladioli]